MVGFFTELGGNHDCVSNKALGEFCNEAIKTEYI